MKLLIRPASRATVVYKNRIDDEVNLNWYFQDIKGFPVSMLKSVEKS